MQKAKLQGSFWVQKWHSSLDFFRFLSSPFFAKLITVRCLKESVGKFDKRLKLFLVGDHFMKSYYLSIRFCDDIQRKKIDVDRSLKDFLVLWKGLRMDLMASLAAFLSDILLFGTLLSIVNYQMCIEKARNDLSGIEKWLLGPPT